MLSTLIALLALLLSGPAFGADRLGGAPHVVDAIADKQGIEPPSQSSRPTPAPNKNSRDATAEVDSQQRLNELQRQLLDTRREFLDARARNIDSWLTAAAIFLTLLGVVAAIAGYLSFQRLGEVEAEARQNAESSREHAEEAERLVGEIRARRSEADKLLNPEAASKNSEEAARIAARVQRDPTSSEIDRARATAVQLQQQGEIKEAIEKWRSIANVVEDRQLQAQAWFSIGYLLSDKELEAKIDAYTKAIDLAPAYALAHNNRGGAKIGLEQYQDALADFDRAIALDPAYALAHNNRGYALKNLGRINEAREAYQKALALAQAVGHEQIVTMAKHNLSLLDDIKEP